MAIGTLPARPSGSTDALRILLETRRLQPYVHKLDDMMHLTGTCRALRRHHPINDQPQDVGLYATLLARQIREPERVPAAAGRMLRVYDRRAHGDLGLLMADCRDLIWRTDSWHAHSNRHPDARQLTPARRQLCMEFLCTTGIDGLSLDDAKQIVAHARKWTNDQIIEMLGTDVAVGALTGSFLVLGAGAATAGATIGLQEGHAVWSSGTRFAHVKGVLSAVPGFFLAGIGAYFTYEATAMAVGYVRASYGPVRRAMTVDSFGRDAMLMRYVCHRRQRLPEDEQ